MTRRIRPKSRPKSSETDEGTKKRIKIRRGPASTDPLQVLIKAATKEAQKEAGFKGFKSGVKSGTKKAQKKVEKLEKELTATQQRLTAAENNNGVSFLRLRTVEKALSRMVAEIKDNNFDTRLLLNLNDSGVPMRQVGEHAKLSVHKWCFAWVGNEVLRDTDGVDRRMPSQGGFARHRLHPTHKIPIREMHPIWDSVSNAEVPDIDPMQGMRGTWYWNRRRYSSHSAAMNAWRRHMHNRVGGNDIPAEYPDSFIPRAVETDEDAPMETVSRAIVSPHQLEDEVLEDEDDNMDHIYQEQPEEDSDDWEEDIPHMAADPEILDRMRRRTNIRGRCNALLRGNQLPSCRYWEQLYAENMPAIDSARDHHALSPLCRIASHFMQPYEDWDNDNYDMFCRSVSNYIERTTGAIRLRDSNRMQGVRRTRRRASGREYSGGYNRSNY